jgi:two-component system sensor histidine kinase TctE
MPAAIERAPSIRRRLLAVLVLPVTVVLVAGALIDYVSSLTTVLTADIVELGVILGLVWLGVSIALKPLQALRLQIARRSARALDPLPMEPVPLEVRALVATLNRLFVAIDDNNRAQRAFVENATHQLRTPLAGIHAQIELMIEEESGAEKRARLTRTLQATERLARTSNQLLALARSEHAAYGEGDVGPMNLAHIAETTVPEHVDRAVAAGVDLGAELEPARVCGIPWLIAEAIDNLVDNAIRHTPESGAVTVRCGMRGETAFLEVEDTGIGIPPEERERVTTRFYRGRDARGEGTGLGLAIVAEVARVHDAQLSIESGAEGRGTRVRMEMRAPRAQAS